MVNDLEDDSSDNDSEDENFDDSLEEETLDEDLEEEISETEGNDYGTYIIVIGVIITIGVLGLKVAAVVGGSFDILGITVADKIYTGGDNFSTYFFSGLIVGILVVIIGIVTRLQSKVKEVEESSSGEEWTEEEEEEEEKEGICPTCGAVIPIDSEVCPECGEELAPPEEEETGEEEIIEEEVIEE